MELLLVCGLCLLLLLGAAVQAQDMPPAEFVSVNQTGYFPNGVKIAVYPTEQETSQTFEWLLVDEASGATVASGQTQPGFRDMASGDFVRLIDFSGVTAPGRYVMKVGGASSVPFTIGSDIYESLAVDALRYFYLNRSGIELDPQHAGQWARPDGHPGDHSVTCFRGLDSSGRFWEGCDYTIDASGGWYDAGDYGKYVVNGGISVWQLMNSYEFNPAAFGDGALNIPESGDGFPDILDEARWEVEFLMAMQVPDGQPQAGMAFHKLHSLKWDAMPISPMRSIQERFLMPPSTAATLNLAAAAAQCARLWRELDAPFADRCLTAAERAWQAANDNPIFTYGSIPGNAVGGGDYGDGNVEDEFFWAAAELYVTTGEQAYHDYLAASPYFAGQFAEGQETALTWGDVGIAGTLTLALHAERLSADEQTTVRDLLIRIADHYAAVTAGEGYRVAMPPTGYSWGNNSYLLNNGMVMAYAYRLTGDARYLDAAVETMDYVLGRNGLNFSFVAGYGTYAMRHPHHRFWADRPAIHYPPVAPGSLAGGPNARPADPPSQAPEIASRPTAKRYIDDIGSYSTNEVAINWNASLAWVAAFLDAQYGA
ncbi:MAG: glycoside hydrolase family 9 protein [Anaerolineae bacterium]|nr:glycoside hydrolase family 9 protein [Anaerolineae bacterium]